MMFLLPKFMYCSSVNIVSLTDCMFYIYYRAVQLCPFFQCYSQLSLKQRPLQGGQQIWSLPNYTCFSVTELLSKADTSVIRTADTFFQNLGSKTSQNGHRMFTLIYNRPENSAIWWRASPVPKLNNKRKTTSFVLRWIHKHAKFAWALLCSVRTTKRDATGPSCDHVHWRFGYQVTWIFSKVDTSLKQTAALVPRVAALERVDCISILAVLFCHCTYLLIPSQGNLYGYLWFFPSIDHLYGYLWFFPSTDHLYGYLWFFPSTDHLYGYLWFFPSTDHLYGYLWFFPSTDHLYGYLWFFPSTDQFQPQPSVSPQGRGSVI